MEIDRAEAGPIAAEPDIVRAPADAVPSLYQTIYANGLVWLGYNVMTAESADLGVYDAGDGGAFGIAFGNGQDIKRFLEVGLEKTTRHHVIDDGTGQVIADAVHRAHYIGWRSYLFPVAGETGKVAPFLVMGLAWHTIASSGTGGTPETDVKDAAGLGVYAGTGVELKFSSQVGLAIDFRGSFWNWDGNPQGTGEQGTVGSSMSLVYHF
jgi:hypothetical protein